MFPSNRYVPLCLLWLLLLSPATTTTAQTFDAQTVVAKAVEALGGASRWQQIQSMDINGNYSTFSTTYPFRIRRQRPDLYRFEHYEADMKVVVGFDGDKAWWDNQLPLFAGVNWPTAPSIPYALGFQADAEFAGWPFLDATARGHQMTYAGLTDYEGIASHAVDIRLANGTQETWYFDEQSFRPAVRVARAGYVGREVDSRTFFDDYRQVDGVWLPFLLEFERGNLFAEMIVEQVQLDPEIEIGIFDFPRSPLMRRLASLEGHWNVTVQSRPLPTLPWFESQSTAVIEADFDGRILRETSSFLFAGRPRNISKTFTYDRFSERFAIVQVDDLTAHPNIFIGSAKGNDNTFILGNKESGTSWGVAGHAFTERQTLRLDDPDHFTIVWEQSPDGQHWAEVARFVYKRQLGPGNTGPSE